MFELREVSVQGILQIRKLSIPAQKVTCIMGPSGSGKSTLLRLLNALETPDSGEIFFQGQRIAEIHPVELRRQAVMVPQTPVIFSGSVKDNLLAGLELAEKPKASNDELDRILRRVLLSKDLKTPAEQLSGGEKQRLALARAMLLNPEAFLLDEPTSALDEDTADAVMKNFLDYSRKHASTLVIVTHSKELAEHVADHIVDISSFSTAHVRKGETS